MPDKRILITGTRKGIGRYLATYYADLGYDVIGVSRGQSDVEFKNYEHFQADISKESDVVRLFSDIRRRFGYIDVLINNAGVASMNHSLLTPGSVAQRVFQTNFQGTFLCSREAVKLMMKRPLGRVVNTTTVAIPLLIEGEAVYAASKSAVEVFTKIFAKEVSKFNVTVNAVGPTPIATDLIKNVPQEKISKIVDSLTIHRLGEMTDVANVVDFFISERSDYVTGQVIYLGGA